MIEGHQPLYNYGIDGRGSVGVASSDENDGQVGGRDGLKEIREQLEDLSSNYEMEGFEEQEEEEGAHVKDQDEYSKNERVVWGVGWGEEEWKDMDGDGGNEVRVSQFLSSKSLLHFSDFLLPL